MIAIIAEPRLASPWADALRREDHEVETFDDSFCRSELFDHDPFEIVVVDIDRPDWGEAMLLPQIHAVWPGTKTIAVVPNYGFRSSAVFEMGLWKPDQVLMKPLATRLLCATVSFLWAQLRSEEIRRQVVGSFAGDVDLEEPTAEPQLARQA